MDIDERVKDVIQDIAQRRNNVTLSEIEWVMGKLSGKYKVRRREARHGVLFGVDEYRFMVNHHNPGSKQVKSYSVVAFLNVMIDLGLYEEEDEDKKEPKNE
jgi:hypothetical protein